MKNWSRVLRLCWDGSRLHFKMEHTFFERFFLFFAIQQKRKNAPVSFLAKFWYYPIPPKKKRKQLRIKVEKRRKLPLKIVEQRREIGIHPYIRFHPIHNSQLANV